jgi:gluconate 5-dehydrogenase
MARALVSAGARVAVTSRQLDRAQATALDLGPRATGFALDVREPASVEAFVETAWSQVGPIDVLVNNAGIGMLSVNPDFPTRLQPFWEVAPDGFGDVFATKVTGVFLVARAVVPRMLERGAGRVVTISMSESTMVRPGYVPYGPSGAAVEALSRIMAAELADTPVAVNLLLPGGPTATGMLPDHIPDELRARLLQPEVMGPPVVWLASDQAAGVHDQRVVACEFEAWLAQRTSPPG